MASSVAVPAEAPPLEWRKMNKQELRDALASRGLDTDGLRPLLIQRLESSSRAAESRADAALKEALASQEAGTEEPTKTESQEPDVPKVEVGEVTLAYNLESASKDAVAEKETVKEIVAEVVKPETNGANDSTAGSLTDQEKKQRRAERFGMELQVSEEEKRRKRAARFGGEQGNSKASVDNTTEIEKRKQRAARFGIVDDESRKKAREDRFGHTLKQEDSVESEKRKARAARFSAITEGSEVANTNMNSKSKVVLP